MKGHLWMHVGLAAAVVAVLGLNVIGVAVPTAVVYLLVLACPVMMIVMMAGMSRDQTRSPSAGEGRTTHDVLER
jgi:hypothetical protein